MSKIRLGYKGSATSGNIGHAGRPGKRGGSAPRSSKIVLGVAGPTANEIAIAQSQLKLLHGNPSAAWAQGIDPNNLTPDQVKALRDYSRGFVTEDELKSRFGYVAPVAVLPTQAETDAAAARLTQFQGDINAAYWAKTLDPKTLTPDQIKLLNEYSKGLRTQEEMRMLLAPNVKDPRFYQGDVTGKTADELFRGSSPEVQALALKTGILATDQASLDYIQGKQGLFEKQLTYPSIYENYLSTQPGNVKDIADRGASRLDTAIDSYAVTANTPVQMVSNLRGSHNLTPAEQALVSKMTDLTDKAEQAHNSTYYSLSGGGRYSAAADAQAAVIKAGWAALTPDEKALATSMTQRAEVQRWINSNVNYTVPGATKYSDAPNWKPITIDKIPSNVETAEQVKRLGYEYRGSLMKRPQPMPTTGHKATEIVALSSLPKQRDAAVRAQFDNTWDKVQHSTFSGTVTAAFQVHPQSGVVAAYDAIAKARDNVKTDLYHGTHYGAAKPISATGYKVFPASKAKAGRAMGDGIYLADKSSKSAQYLGTQFTRGTGSGVILVNKASLGVQADTGSYQSHSADTVFGGTNYWRNNEWAVKNAAAVLPDIWLDVSLVGQR